MNFELDDDQLALQTNLNRLLAQRHGFEEARRISAGEGLSEALWRNMAEMGLPALLVPERHGGLGRTATDIFVVMREVGRARLASPLLCGVLVPCAAVAAAADEALQGELLAPLADGGQRLAWAHDEAGGDGGPLWIETRARRDGTRWVLDGAKACVPHGATASGYLVTARVAGQAGDAAGRALFHVRAGTPGAALRAYRLIDGTPAVDLGLREAEAVLVAIDDRAGAGIEAAIAVGVAGACAEMLGGMEAALALTKEYLVTRRQFGRAIGENQALRHSLAQMQVSLELSRSMAMAACAQADAPLEAEARLDRHRAKLVVGQYARSLCEAAIQLHGGIGLTEEYAVGSYLCRVHVLDAMFGDAAHHAAVLADAGKRP